MEDFNLQAQSDLQALKNAVDEIRSQIDRVIVGQDEMVRLVIGALLSGGHVLIEGVPGVAKTLTAKLVAGSLNVPFSRLQFTPDLMPSDVLGTPIFNPASASFEFKKGPLFSNIVLVDEINRAPAKTQSALFEAMEEQQITVDGKTYHMEEPFMVLATQNPVEQEGTYRLPEAQLDRFLFKIVVPYPTEEQEFEILSRFHNQPVKDVLSMVRPVITAKQIEQVRGLVQAIVIDEKLLRFIARLVQQTRKSKAVYLGASPRAALAIMTASKAIAGISGRNFVTPEDILEVAPPVLRHRIILSPEKEMEGTSEDEVLKQIIHSLDIPR